MRLLLIRHGETWANLAGALDTGAPGHDLTPLGHEQAAAAAEVLASEGFDALTSSTLQRAIQTADPISSTLGLSVVQSAGLVEVSAGELEMATDRESVWRYLNTVLEWRKGVLDVQMPGGETGVEFFARYDEAIIAAADSDSVVMVSHAAAIRTWVSQRATNAADYLDDRHHLHNTGGVWLEGTPGEEWKVTRWSSEAIGGL